MRAFMDELIRWTYWLWGIQESCPDRLWRMRKTSSRPAGTAGGRPGWTWRLRAAGPADCEAAGDTTARSCAASPAAAAGYSAPANRCGSFHSNRPLPAPYSLINQPVSVESMLHHWTTLLDFQIATVASDVVLAGPFERSAEMEVLHGNHLQVKIKLPKMNSIELLTEI